MSTTRAPFARPAVFFALMLACAPPVDEPLDDVAQQVTANGVYAIKAVNSGKCVDVTGSSTLDGANIEQWDCHAAANQQFKLHDIGGGLYELVAQNSGKCLDVYKASTSDGANVEQYHCNGGTNQRWTLVAKGSGQYELHAVHSGKCLDVDGASTVRGASLFQWTCHGGTNQRFTFTAVTTGGGSGGTGGAGGSGGSSGHDAGVDTAPACIPESDPAFCARLGKTCGAFAGTDNCGAARSASSCGTCAVNQTCGGAGTSNVCGCKPESDATFCARLGKICGAFAGTDNCGAARSAASCGTCAVNQTCGGAGTPNVCAANPTTFVHPGILVSQAQLDFVKSHLGSEPWKSALAAASSSRFGSLSYAAAPIADVDCGAYSTPDVGCSVEKNDVVAAYTHALLWYFTRDARHATKSIEIMNAWSAVLQTHTNSNAPLQAAWTASIFPRAAEIIRYTYDGWAAADQDRFEQMLRAAYLPLVVNGAPNDNGNWELAMAEATMNIAIFLDDRATFDKAVTLWRKRVPAYIYLASDGPLPVPPPRGSKNTAASLISYWYGQDTFVDGVGQETCRDFGHLQMGFASIAAAAETARIQGVDLFGAEATRIRAGWEFAAQYLNGAPVPAWLCKGTLNLSNDPTWEIAYNHLVNRLGLAMPQAKLVIGKIRPTGATHHMAWETLTHAETGKAQ